MRPPPGTDIVGIAEESFRVGSPEKGAERYPEDPVGLVQVPVDERPDSHLRGSAHARFLPLDEPSVTSGMLQLPQVRWDGAAVGPEGALPRSGTRAAAETHGRSDEGPGREASQARRSRQVMI